MNLLHISCTDIEGGAAQGTYQLHTLLKAAGHQSIVAVRRKDSSDPDVVPVGVRSLRTSNWAERIERVCARLAGGYRVTHLPSYCFNRNVAPVPDWDAVLDAMPKPDVLFLHWITKMVTAADIRRLAQRVKCPIVWVLLDMEPMTGGCHFAGNCLGFHGECQDCPQLLAGGRCDWAWRTWREKRRQLADLPITFLAPTKWLGDRLAASKLFGTNRIAHIPLPLNARLRPFDKGLAREILGLPADRKIVLTGSYNLQDPRKGMERLVSAARILEAQGKESAQRSFRNDEVLFLLMGKNNHALSAEIPFASRSLGYVQSEVEVALAYQAADVFACPSVEDAGPLMVSQAMLCGTPVVAFDTGIAPELITSGEDGYIARLGDAGDFAYGLEQMLANDGSAGRQAAEMAARHHDPQRIVQAYGALLETLHFSSVEKM